MLEKPAIVDEEVAYKRYIRCWHRQVQYNNKPSPVSWDIVGHSITQKPYFCTVLPYWTEEREFSLIAEYAQGPHEMMWTAGAGGFDSKKHGSILDCAKAELAEEMGLVGGEWINLLDVLHDKDLTETISHLDDGEALEQVRDFGIPELKWGTDRYMPFLVLNPKPSTTKVDQDVEEYMSEPVRFTQDQTRNLILLGRVLPPTVQTFMMAEQVLKQRKQW
jgi:hypothetical protein